MARRLKLVDDLDAGDASSQSESTAATDQFTDGSGAEYGLAPFDLTVFNGEVLFPGADAGGYSGLWVTNGTTAGTTEVGGIGDAGVNGVSARGLVAAGLTVFNGEFLFSGEDAAGLYGLWVTDGTAAGTYEITGINGVSASGISPGAMIVFNGEVLFGGWNAAGVNSLWVTNGTATGTYELAGISGAAASGVGFQPYWLTVFNGEVLFAANDSAGLNGLWVSNGTAAGTYELTSISGAATTGFGFGPSYLTVYNGEVLFNGTDTAGHPNLWVTNGTAAGTSELTGIMGASASGLNPYAFTVFNGEVLFSGYDAAGRDGLWVTNGTAAGTYELTGISGAYASGRGLEPAWLTAFNGEVLFQGVDAAGYDGLWVTNGTAAGTHEITGISGASTTGLVPFGMTVFNGEVLFDGYNADGYLSLWKTDGTAAGTVQIPATPVVSITTTGGLTNQPSQTIMGQVEATDTATVTLYDNGSTTPIGTATVGANGAWSAVVTLAGDGTHNIVADVMDAAGNMAASNTVVFTLDTIPPTVSITTMGELTNKPTQTISGMVTASEAPVGSTVMIYDNYNETPIATATVGAGGAWSAVVTLSGDGTHSIIAEETDLAGNLGVSNTIVFTLDTKPPAVSITAAGGMTDQASQTISGTVTATEAPVGSTVTLYDNGSATPIGTATVGAGGIWSAVVTLAGDGTHSIVAEDTDSAGNLGMSNTVVFTLVPPGPYDFPGNGVSDVLFQNSGNGEAYEWLMNGTTVTSSGFAGNNTNPSWQVVTGAGDYNGDGKSDILWQNVSTGQVYEYQMNGTSVIASNYVGNNTDPTLHAVASGDFNGDGYSDILFQNINTGQVTEWEMNGFAVIGSGVVGNNTDPTWQVVGTGDFNGDGKSDILFQNTNSGQVYEWEMNGLSVLASNFVGNNTNPAWQVVGIGDLNGDGKSDILFQNSTTGQVYEWEMNGTTVIGSGLVGNNTNPAWQVVGTGDYSGNGQTDILFQNVTSGQVYEWVMNGTTLVTGSVVGNNTDPTWHAIGKT